MPKALGLMAKQVEKHLRETSLDENLLKRVLDFQKHRRLYWNEVIFIFLFSLIFSIVLHSGHT